MVTFWKEKDNPFAWLSETELLAISKDEVAESQLAQDLRSYFPFI